MSRDSGVDRFMVRWPARTMDSNRQIQHIVITAIMQGGLSIEFPHNLPIGASLNIEFYVTYENKRNRIRAKTKVVYCLLFSGSSGARIDLKIIQAAPEELHLLNNVLMTLANSSEVDLRL